MAYAQFPIWKPTYIVQLYCEDNIKVIGQVQRGSTAMGIFTIGRIMGNQQQTIEGLRSRFDKIYESQIIGGGFFESDDYYRNDKERYWRSFELLSRLDLPTPARILEIGGGQMALLRTLLLGDACTVGDISSEYAAPIQRAGIKFVTLNLTDVITNLNEQFDAILLLEVIEHIPVPASIIFQHIKPLLKPKGTLFLTTPNLFRMRNLIRMFLGREFLDRFMLPQAGHGLGHQLEYSANHLQWQLERAGMEIVMLVHDNLGRKGHSSFAQLARWFLAPFDLRPLWRDGLVAAARNKN